MTNTTIVVATPPRPYATVNTVWPEGTHEGRAVKQEALAGAKRLYRLALGKPWRGPMKLTSGRNRTSIRGGVFYVNPDSTWDAGWHGIVHAVSHHASWRLYGENHGLRHAWIERQLVHHVVSKGWLEGKLRKAPKPPYPKWSSVALGRSGCSTVGKQKPGALSARCASTRIS